MVHDTNIESQANEVVSDDYKMKYLLHYILEKRGVCNERDLSKALKTLEGINDESDKVDDRLKEYITSINVNLNTVGYKLIRCMGRLGERCYVYIDDSSSEETKMATQLKPDEITYVKWCIDMFLTSEDEPIVPSGPRTAVQIAVDAILMQITGKSDIKLPLSITYTVGSTELCQFEQMGPLDCQELLLKLCRLKWFYCTEQGRFGINVRALQELKEFLRSRYELPVCQVCYDIALEGVKCSCLRNAWHVTCFRHHSTHVSLECGECGTSLLKGMYMI